MKRILFLFLPFLPYLASAQVAKDTVTVLTLAQIPAGAIRDTTNITFVQNNAFAKATFDSLAKYTRVKLQTYTLDSTHITASGLNLQGTRFTGVLPVTRGGTGNTTGLAATATALATARTIQTNLASTSAASFDGTANITPGVTGQLPVGNGGTGTGTQFTAGSVVFAGTSGVYSQDNANFFYNSSTKRLGLGTASPIGPLDILSPTSNRWRFTDGGSNITPMISLSSSSGKAIGLIVGGTGGGFLYDNTGFFVIQSSSKADITGGASIGGTTQIIVDTTGIGLKLGGATAPTAILHIAAGSSAAKSAPLKFTSGTNLTTPEAGAMEFNGTNLFFTPSTTRHTVNHGLTGSATLEFLSTNAQSSRDMTIIVTGASVGDVVSLGVPNASVNANTCFTAWVSAADTVTVRFNNYSSGAVDPTSGTFKVFVTK